MENPQKKCSKCKLMKTTNSFSHSKSEKDGLFHYCKECEKVKSLKYRESNKETIAEKYKIYREANKDKINLQKRERIICECGFEINKNSMARHLKNKIHSQLMQNKNNGNPLDV
jgi:hypothetical protein